MSTPAADNRKPVLFAESGRLIMMLAQREAATRQGTQSNVRPIHLLLAAARAEKVPVSRLLERLGLTAKQLADFLAAKGQPRDSDDGRPNWKPETQALVEQFGALTERWGTKYVDGWTIVGALAESDDAELAEAFAACGISGPSLMAAVVEQLRAKGVLKA